MFLLLLVCAPLAAGAQEFHGTLTGHTTDPDGAFIPASVTVVDDATQQTWTPWVLGQSIFAALEIA